MKLKNTILLFLFIILAARALNAEEPDLKDILLLNSYHPTSKWTADITDGVLQEFSNNKKYRVFVEYMDSKRFQSKEYIEDLSHVYAHKYASASIDGIIVSDNNAFDFILEHGNNIWGDVPVAFCGNNNIRDYDIDTTRFKGVDEQINIDSTLQVIKILQPGLEELIVISDSTVSGMIFSNQFIETVKANHPLLKYKLVHAESPLQLALELRKTSPGKKAIYLLSLYADRGGFEREIIEESDVIPENYPFPVYSNWDFLFGDFIVGGVVIRGKDQGLEAAKAMKDMLKGKDRPWLIPPKEKLALDYFQIKRNALNKSGIEDKALIINKPQTPLERFRKEIYIITAVLTFLIIVIVVLLEVISRKRKTGKKLIKSESRLEMALEGANEGLWDMNLETGDVFLSQKIANLLNYNNPNEINFNKNNYTSVFHPEDRAQILEAFQMHQEGLSHLFKSEARIQAKTGEYFWFAIHGKIIERNEKRLSVRMLGTITEIQSQKEFEHELKEAKNRAEESDRLKSAFLANMSHEIRTPMNAILGFTDLLMSDIIDKKEKNQYLGMIKNSGENLLNIINDIIDISKIESGQLKINKETFDLHKMLEDLKTISHNLIHQKEKNLRFRVHNDSSNEQFWITADPYRLQQILLNLITNAIKFTQNGGIDIGYTIKDQNELEFYVKDTGHGIAPQHKKIIFERFRQVDDTSIRKFGGTGLGLAITKSLVTMMKGEMTLKSEIGKGSVFSFTLPCDSTGFFKTYN